MAEKPRSCERCGAIDGHPGARDKHGKWHAEDDIHAMNSAVGESLFGDDWDWHTPVAQVGVVRKGPDIGKALCGACRWKAPRVRVDPIVRHMARTGQTALALDGAAR